jgi:hypothetical protein
MTKDFYKTLALIAAIVILFSAGIFTYYFKRDIAEMNGYRNIPLQLPVKKVDKEHRVDNNDKESFEFKVKRTE